MVIYYILYFIGFNFKVKKVKSFMRGILKFVLKYKYSCVFLMKLWGYRWNCC